MGELNDSAAHRRVSPRLQNVPAEKRPFYGSAKRKADETKDDVVRTKKTKVAKPPKPPVQNSKPEVEPSKGEVTMESSESKVTLESGESKDCVDWSWYTVADLPLTDENGVSYTARVRETLRAFNLHYLHHVQEEEKRCCKPENGSPIKSPSKRPPKGPSMSPSKKTDKKNDDEPKKQSKRPDLKALSEMLKENQILFPEKQIGHLPGIAVGHQFYSRAEMVALGFHSHWLNGIDFVGESKGKEKFRGYKLPFALIIVVSGQYEDDVDNAEEIVYTGQGGNDLLGNKQQIADQVMKRGNLALKNNMDQGIPVRVVRGHDCVNSYTSKVYTYDGLYKVNNYWAEKGVAGFTVFKYRLKRLPGKIVCVVNFVRARGSKVHAELPGLVCKDICYGQENICIPATNVIDKPPVAPEGLKYINSIIVEKDVNIPPNASGCRCKGNCTNPLTCSCAQLNGGDFPYVSKDGGRLIEAKAVVFECGPNCGCGPGCVNRTSQRGMKHRLEVFRTDYKGWGVRSWDFIPSGAPVCEYIGVLRKTDEVDSLLGNEYIFEIDCWHTMHGIGSREKRMCDVTIPNGDAESGFSKLSESEPEFCIDAASHGNVTRYINHSCEPNLFVQCVLSSHHDVRLARIVLFAADNIPPLQELSYDYGYELDSVVGLDGKIKQLDCHCGAVGCRKRLY